MQLSHGGSVDELSFAKQHQRLHDLRNTCNDIASGRATHRYKGPSVETWAKMILVLRRRPDKNRKVSEKVHSTNLTHIYSPDLIFQPIRAEILREDRIESVDARDIKAGDIVDVPVWMDVWYGGGGIIVHPWTFMSFDRVVIVERGMKDVPK